MNSKSIDSFPPLRLRVWLCLTPFQLLLKKKKKWHRLGACKKRASISPALEAGGQGRARAEAGSVRTCLLAHGGLCSLCPPVEAGLGLPGSLLSGVGPPTPVTSSPPEGPPPDTTTLEFKGTADFLLSLSSHSGFSALKSVPPRTAGGMPDSAAPTWPRRSQKEASVSPLCVQEKRTQSCKGH